MSSPTPRFIIEDLNAIDSQRCPCGLTRRAFSRPDNFTATLHLLDVSVDAQTHYHKRMTEIYLILEGTGHIELDGQLFAVRPMMTVMIKPGCRHRAIGRLKIINIPIPAFDPGDEYFD